MKRFLFILPGMRPMASLPGFRKHPKITGKLMKVLLIIVPLFLTRCPRSGNDRDIIDYLLLSLLVETNSAPSNRVDIVILGEGYTAMEYGKFMDDLDRIVPGLMNKEPFKSYESYFVIHKIFVESPQSGADNPYISKYVDTAFDAHFGCDGIERGICVNNEKVFYYLNRNTSLSANQKDIILVVVNDDKYGGTGGAIATITTNARCTDVVSHELGHSFGLLEEEFDYEGSSPCDSSVEPIAPNVTTKTAKADIKWNYWIDAATPLPTVSTTDGVPGLYEGANYCPSHVYRPTYNSAMRNTSQPFEQINEEQIIKRIYNLVNPLDSCTPSRSSITLTSAETRTFTARIMQTTGGTVSAKWSVDGTYTGSGTEFLFTAADYGSGSHTVKVTVHDDTAKVRKDEANVLTGTKSWTVNVK